MCGLVKLYFRVLPKSLITTDVFERFIHAGKKLKLIYGNKNNCYIDEHLHVYLSMIDLICDEMNLYRFK